MNNATSALKCESPGHEMFMPSPQITYFQGEKLKDADMPPLPPASDWTYTNTAKDMTALTDIYGNPKARLPDPHSCILSNNSLSVTENYGEETSTLWYTLSSTRTTKRHEPNTRPPIVQILLHQMHYNQQMMHLMLLIQSNMTTPPPQQRSRAPRWTSPSGIKSLVWSLQVLRRHIHQHT